MKLRNRRKIFMANQEISFPDKQFIVSKTDKSGKITYGNALFIKMSGYTEEELLGAPHNILRHPEMPKIVFKLLWDYVKSGNEIFAYVKNRTKNGDYYWVYAHVTPSFDDNGHTIGYHSARRKPSAKALNMIVPLYTSLLNAEKSGGITASQKLLETKLSEAGKSYEEFIFAL